MLEFFETLPHFDFDLPDSDGESPLFYAIVKKNLEIVKFLVGKGADLTRRSTTNKWSVVYIAATLGNTETLEYLISLGCEVNAQTSMKRNALTKACWVNRHDSVRILLKHPDINIEHKANADRSALQMAVWGPYGGRQARKMGVNPYDSPECVQLLLDAGADPSSRDSKGKSCLHTACQTGGERSIPLLLKYGANINARTNRGSTPLHTCFYFGNIGPLKRLLEFVPDPESKFKVEPLDTGALFIDEQGRTFTPIECSVGRDRYMMWEFISSEEAYLKDLGYPNLTFGTHNFDTLFEKALKFKAFKCLQVLIKHYLSHP